MIMAPAGRHGHLRVDVHVRHIAAAYLGEPAVFREPLQSDRLHRIWGEAKPDQRFGACGAQRQIFALTNGLRAVDAAIEVPVPE